MFEHTGWATGVGRGAVGPPHLPALAAVDLRTLRVTDDAALGEAVERVLRRPADLIASWPEDTSAG
ncbi:hypothetical protein [Streptomyces sp. NPDC003327]